ncbi:MAG: hypothetical protein K2J71_02510 [Oscillospiraceae bacterium]|nr:hypothetical protein [Oscillospiraceae bacterium]
MNDKKCFGYYIVKPLIKPEWCTLKTSHILSVSENGLSEKFPDLEKCFWINYPKSNRTEYQRYLQLSDYDFQDFCKLVADLFEHKRLTTDVRFYCMDDVIKISQYLRNADGYRIIGIFTDSEIFDEFDNKGTFDVVKAGIECSKPKKIIGCDILGCESSGEGYFSFDSYLINSLNEELEQLTDHSLIVDARTGLIQNSYEETKQYCDLIQGQGEPVIWTPYEIYEIYEF